MVETLIECEYFMSNHLEQLNASYAINPANESDMKDFREIEYLDSQLTKAVSACSTQKYRAYVTEQIRKRHNPDADSLCLVCGHTVHYCKCDAGFSGICQICFKTEDTCECQDG
jgi:hypothetical protein